MNPKTKKIRAALRKRRRTLDMRQPQPFPKGKRPGLVICKASCRAPGNGTRFNFGKDHCDMLYRRGNKKCPNGHDRKEAFPWDPPVKEISSRCLDGGMVQYGDVVYGCGRPNQPLLVMRDDRTGKLEANGPGYGFLWDSAHNWPLATCWYKNPVNAQKAAVRNAERALEDERELLRQTIEYAKTHKVYKAAYPLAQQKNDAKAREAKVKAKQAKAKLRGRRPKNA